MTAQLCYAVEPLVDWSWNNGDFWSLNVNVTSSPTTFTIVVRGDQWSGIDVMKQITIYSA